jgi:hypothetical protein
MNVTTAEDNTPEDVSDIQGVQVVKSITQAAGKITVIETAKADKFGSASKALAVAKAYTDEVKADVIGTADDAAGVDTIKGANKAAAAAQATADKVVTAVNATAVQFVSAELKLSKDSTSGKVGGRVIAVYGANGVQAYPEITFADNESTIAVEGLANEETFTVIYATTITIA